MKNQSPGLYITEADQSAYTPAQSSAILGMVATASKGPVNELTLITDEASLIATFGQPSSTHIALLSAMGYLRRGNSLWFVRVAHYDATAQSVFKNVASVSVGTIDAVSSGSWANKVTVVVGTGTKAGTYKLTVKDNGTTVEVYDLLKVGAANVTDQNYLVTRVNGISNYISIVLTSVSESLKLETLSVLGGDDGVPVSASDYVGSAGSPPTVPATGLHLFDSAEAIDIDLLAIPGITDASVIAAGVTLAEDRGDCLYIIDTPQNLSVAEAVEWTDTTNLNSSYAAVFYPWLKVLNTATNENTWIPPSGHIAGIMAHNDTVQNIWDAPAGDPVGRLTDVQALEYSPTQGDREFMYGNGNVVNPIVSFRGQGIIVWGQRTTQRLPTARDRINVRRLLIMLKKSLGDGLRTLVFRPDNASTWQQYINICTPILAAVQAGGGLFATDSVNGYRVICDTTTNTVQMRQNGIIVGNILIVATKTGEVVALNLTTVNSITAFVEA